MTRLLPLLLAAALLSACAPVYAPSAANLPLLRVSGSAHLAGLAMPGGAQVNGAYAVTESVSVKATGHFSRQDSSRYSLGSGGIGWSKPIGETGVGALSLEAGGGNSKGKLDIRIGATEIEQANSGSFGRFAAQADLGLDRRWGAAAIALRLVHFRFSHDGASRAPGQTESWWFGEPVVALRLGPPKLRLEAQTGLSFPLSGKDNVSGFIPIFLSLGLATHF